MAGTGGFGYRGGPGLAPAVMQTRVAVIVVLVLLAAAAAVLVVRLARAVARFVDHAAAFAAAVTACPPPSATRSRPPRAGQMPRPANVLARERPRTGR